MRWLALFLIVILTVNTAGADVVSTFDLQVQAQFQAGRTILTFDELTVPSPYYMPLPPDTYAGQGLKIRTASLSSILVARLPQLGDFGPTLSAPNIIGGGTGGSDPGWRTSIRFDFLGELGTAIGASTDWTGSHTTLTAYQSDGTVIASVGGDQGAFMGIRSPGIAYAIWNWDHDESVVGYSLDNVTFSGTCNGDLNGDGTIDLSDLAVLLANYGKTNAAYADGDLDGNGTVELADLAALLALYGKNCS